MQDLQNLIEKIKQANKDYYILGSSNLSDEEYDLLVEELRILDPKNSILNSVGDNSEIENKVKLPYIMGSLNKIRPDEVDINKLYPGQDLIEMLKLDGISMQIQYKDKKFFKLFTRGNGFEGQDITERGKLMNFPKEVPDSLSNASIFGEAVVSRLNFTKVKGEYKSMRNFVGGTLRPILTNEQFKSVSEDVLFNSSLLDIVVYGGENLPEFNTFESCLNTLSAYGFNVVNYNTVKAHSLTPEYLERRIKEVKENSKYLTDGLVLRINKNSVFNSLGREANGLNPKGARAVKASLTEQFSQLGIIKEIEWNISKRGLFIPTVILEEPLIFDGVDVTRVTGINAKTVAENNWGKGSEVVVIRSGDVVPRIISTLNISTPDLISECPYCGTKLYYNDTHILCGNEGCKGRNKAQIIDFFVSLNLEDIGYDTIGNLYNKGYDTFEKLIEITYEKLIELEGYQASKALKVRNALNSCLKGITLATLMSISQLFQNEKTSLAEAKMQLVIDAYGEDKILSSLRNEKDSSGFLKKLDPKVLLDIKGFGPASIDIFTKNWISFKKLFLRLEKYVEFVQPKQIGTKLSGKIFAFTNFRDSELEEVIINNGGQIKGVTKKTSVLFSAGDGTVKVVSAQKFGIPIVSAHLAKQYVENLLNS